MTLRALQAIVFDFDGVIADSERLHLLAYQEVLKGEGLALSKDAYLERYLGYDDVGVFKAIGKDQNSPMPPERVESLIERKGERYEALASAGEMLFPGAADFIRVAAAAVPIAIASGALTHEIVDVLERAGLRDLFPVIVGADQTERSKPHPDPYRTAFAKLRARRFVKRCQSAVPELSWFQAGIMQHGVDVKSHARCVRSRRLIIRRYDDICQSVDRLVLLI